MEIDQPFEEEGSHPLKDNIDDKVRIPEKQTGNFPHPQETVCRMNASSGTPPLSLSLSLSY